MEDSSCEFDQREDGVEQHEKTLRVRWLSEQLFELGGASSVCSRFYSEHSLDDQIGMLEGLIDVRLASEPKAESPDSLHDQGEVARAGLTKAR